MIQHQVEGIPDIWIETRGDSRVCIAVLDGPVDLGHSCFADSNIQVLESIVGNSVNNGAACRHGTNIASLLLGKHGTSVSGIAPDCKGIVIPIFATDAHGGVVPCSQVDLARAILLAAQSGANVINISGGQFSESGEAFPMLADAVRFCDENGVLIVSATGNDGCNCLHIPSSIPSVLAVGAMDVNGEPLESSNWGTRYRQNGILALGDGLVGATVAGDAVSLTGTSIATSVVSGVVALLMSMQLRRNQPVDAARVRQALLSTATGCQPTDPDAVCNKILNGRLNIPAVLRDMFPPQDMHPREKAPEMSDIYPSSSDVKKPLHQEAVCPDENVFDSTEAISNTPLISRQEIPVTSSSALAIQPSCANTAQSSAGVAPSCGCGGGNGGPEQLVYALGKIYFDFESAARRDSIREYARTDVLGVPELLAYLDENPWDSSSITWTLQVEDVPIYALSPSGPFAREAYDRIRQFVKEQVSEGVDIVAIPAFVNGKTTLSSGQTLPTICPEIRGMASWNKNALLEALGVTTGVDQALGNFLDRIYFSYRNQGLTPQERAINYAATNAFNLNKAFEMAHKDELQLDEFFAEKSPLCRPESECWDVKLSFFYPVGKNDPHVRRIFRFTVDVSDTVPVMIGGMKIWDERKHR